MNRLIWTFLIATRLRDRLRCPSCSAVGTFKLHAPTKNADGGEVPWRWLCKWCGYYRDKNKSGLLCYPSPSKKCWVFLDDGFDVFPAFKDHANWDLNKRLTPNQVLGTYAANHGTTIWPWRG